MKRPPITFGPFTLDPATGTLLRGSDPIPLGQRSLTLLQTLLEAEGRPVTKSALLDAAWPGQIIEEGNLTVQISALRKAIGRDIVITVPRVGYRLVATSGKPLTPELTLPVLAVLPFVNLSGDPEQDYFADGVVEGIITALSKFRSFAVVSRNSSFSYKGRAALPGQIAEDLGVRYVLQGSIRRAGNRLRISTHLVDCGNSQTIWAENYEGVVEEVFEFQDQITASAAMLVEPMIQQAELDRSRRDRPGSIAAYDLYLRALPEFQLATEIGNRKAIDLVTEALMLEPDNPVYLARVASWISARSLMGFPPIGPDDRQRCQGYVTRALTNAKQNATVLTHCGDVLLHFLRDYDWAVSTVRSAVDVNPNDHWANIHAGVMTLHCGDLAESLAWFHRAIRLSPRDPVAFVR